MKKIYPKKCTKCSKGFSKGIVIDGGQEYYCSEKCCLEQHKEEKVFPINDKLVTYSEFLKAIKEDQDIFNEEEIFEWYAFTEWYIPDLEDGEAAYDSVGTKIYPTFNKHNYVWDEQQ